jgi:hypothetical protein
MNANGRRSAPILLGITTLVLLTASLLQMYLVIPSYRRLLDGAGIVVSLPARAAIGVSHLGLLIFALLLVGLGLAYRSDRHGRPGAFEVALTAAALLAAIYLCLASLVYFDFARTAARIQ